MDVARIHLRPVVMPTPTPPEWRAELLPPGVVPGPAWLDELEASGWRLASIRCQDRGTEWLFVGNSFSHERHHHE